jgi:hypothetical protein
MIIYMSVYQIANNGDDLSDGYLIAKSYGHTGGMTAYATTTFLFPQTEQIRITQGYYFVLETDRPPTDSQHLSIYHKSSDDGTSRDYLSFDDDDEVYLTRDGRINLRIYNQGLSTSDYITSQTMCVADSRTESTVRCSTPLDPIPEFTGTFSVEQSNIKLELTLRDSAGELVDSTAYLYDEAGYFEWDWYTSAIGSSTGSIFTLDACLVPGDSFSAFGYGECIRQIWGNGTSTEEYMDYVYGYSDTLSGESLYDSLNCSDVSILSVASSTYCALLWAFEPSAEALQKFDVVKDKLLYIIPIGYATHMITDLKELTATSTTYEFDMNEFGLSSTTITFPITEYAESAEEDFTPLFDTAEKFVWILFGVWVVGYGLSRRL